MNRIKERPEYKLRLSKLASPRAWGTAAGAAAFAKANQCLLPLPDRTLVAIDFTGIERADVSFLREAVVEVVRKHRPRLLFIVAELVDADVRANLESALALRGEALLIRRMRGAPIVAGKQLPREHELTLRTLQEHEEFTSAMLTARPFALESSTASARLTALWNAGLVDRAVGVAPSGGKEYKYSPIT